jgi:hypothetical protein
MSITTKARAVFLLVLYSNILSATTIQEVSIDDLAINAELVFEGRCIDTVVSQIPNSRFVKTVATFEVADVIKGDYQGTTIQLEYLGGKLNGKELKVGDMQLPLVGDHGIYFVEKLNEQQVHPLLGWDQGRINISQDSNGIERVGTADDKPITSLESQSKKSPTATQSHAISTGVARGVQAVEQNNWESALSKQDFKNKIKDIINQQ